MGALIPPPASPWLKSNVLQEAHTILLSRLTYLRIGMLTPTHPAYYILTYVLCGTYKTYFSRVTYVAAY